MNFIEKAAVYLFNDHCFERYVTHYDFLNVECFKSTLSKCLGLSIVAGSFLVKLPQILKIIHSKSGYGISIASVLLDLTAITICASYNYVKQFPFSAWGDNAFLSIQTAIIAFLILMYANKTAIALIFSLIYFGVIFMLTSGLISLHILWSLQALNIPLLLMGKLSQAYANYKNQSTGQLSAITVFMLFFGSLARIFTSIQETGDSMMITTYLVSSSVNTLITFQMLYYWTSSKSKPKSKSKLKTKSKIRSKNE